MLESPGTATTIVGDNNKERLALVKNAGYETVDISKPEPVAEQIEKIMGKGKREVDCGVDAVGFEAHGYGPNADEDPAALINALFEVTRANGAMGIPGVYAPGGSQAKTPEVKAGRYGSTLARLDQIAPPDGGSVPRDPLSPATDDGDPRWSNAVLTKLLNVEFITLDGVPEAYKIFDQGSPKKFVIGPHGSVKKAAQYLSRARPGHSLLLLGKRPSGRGSWRRNDHSGAEPPS